MRLLGPVELGADGGALGPRDRVVLAALALRCGESVSPEQLADALWAGSPPASWTKVVQGCVSRLRRVLGAPAIETTPAGYRLRDQAVELDRDEFEALVDRARESSATGSPERAARLLADALTLWRGRPFAELEEWMPGRVEASRLVELRLTAQEDLLEARLEAGEHREVAEEGTVLVREEPLRERRWALLALAQYRCERQADALASIRAARRVLGRELGLDPGSTLVMLERAILGQDPALAADHESRVAASRCPWKGLASYTAEDEDTFHGRRAEIEQLVVRLRGAPLLVVTGPSGSGKSSLLNAGLAPALRRQGRVVATFSPGSDGHAAMTLARSSVPGEPVLLVDQFEEAFTLGPEEQAAAWLAELASYAEHVAPVVVTLRADHVAHLTLDADFSRLAERGMHLVAPLAGDALRDAIEEPARQSGLRFEPGLVDLVMRDAEHQPGALPLLSHALTETWQRREGPLLTVEGYRACGGIRGAVATSADRLYEGLSAAERTQLRWLMLRMVTLADGGEPVRTALPHAAVGEERGKVLDLLVRSRLVTSGGESCEIAHEALVRAWPRLRAWLDEDKAGQRIARHLSTTAWGWDSLGRPDSELYQGARLAAALELQSRPGSDLTPLESEFLAASQERARDEQRQLELQAHRQRVQNRRLRALLGGVVALLVVAVVAGIVAVDRGRAAGQERDTARSAELTAQRESLVGRSLTLRASNRSVAALLAVEAYRRQPDVLAQSALLGTFTASPGFLGYQYLSGGTSLNGAVIPQTQRAVVSGRHSHLGVLDITTGVIRHPFGPPLPRALDYSVVRVSRDGQRVAQLAFAPRDPSRCGSLGSLRHHDGRGCSVLVVHDIATGRRLLGPLVVPFSGGDVAINQDGTLVAVTGGMDGDLATYDVRAGRRLGTLSGLPRPGGVDVWRDTGAVTIDLGDHVYLGSLRGPVREVDGRTLRVLRTLPAPPLSTHNDLVITDDDVLVGAGDRAQVAIDLRTGASRWTVDLRDELSSEPCPFFAVADAVDRTYCGNYFGQLEERSLSTGQRTGVRLDPQLGSVGDLVVSGDGRELVAFAAGEAAYSRWRLDGSGLMARLLTPGYAAVLGYDPSGSYLVTEPDPRLQHQYRWFGPVGTHGDMTGVRGAGAVIQTADDVWVADAPRADHLAWAGPGTLAYWGRGEGGLVDVESGRSRSATALGGATGQVHPDPGGTDAWATASHGSRGTVRRFSLATGAPSGVVLTVPGEVQSVVVTPDGGSVLVTYAGAEDWATARFDVASGRRLATGMPGQVRTAISATGRLVAADSAGAITEFDPRDLSPVATLPGARGSTSSLQFGDRGTRLVVTSADQTVQVYDMASRSRLGEPIESAAHDGLTEGWLRPDGSTVAVNGQSGVVAWVLDAELQAQAACVLAGRNLTRTEWSTYLGNGEPYRATCPAYPDGG